MSTIDIRAARPALPSDHRIGQGTAVEQSRAAAEVQAAVVVAQQCPRDVQGAMRQMRESCAQKGLAERAFFRYSRGGNSITGASVHLARELARCWGNIQYGLVEMRRDDTYGQSEMQAFAWDVQTNSRNSSTFVVPHKRDTKDGTKQLTEMRDVYENNANNGARRVREAIFAILPPWFVEEAQELCRTTLQKGGGDKPLERRIADAIGAFADRFGVTTDQLETKLARKSTSWTIHDLTTLLVIHKSLERGEITVDEEFPKPRVTAEEIEDAPAPTSARTPKRLAVVEDAPEAPEDEPPVEPEPYEPSAPVDDDGWPAPAQPGSGARR